MCQTNKGGNVEDLVLHGLGHVDGELSRLVLLGGDGGLLGGSLWV